MAAKMQSVFKSRIMLSHAKTYARAVVMSGPAQAAFYIAIMPATVCKVRVEWEEKYFDIHSLR